MVQRIDTISPETAKQSEPNTVNLVQTLKATQPQHPALNRLRAKLVASGEKEVLISRYDRMHHRHNRS